MIKILLPIWKEAKSNAGINKDKCKPNFFFMIIIKKIDWPIQVVHKT